MTERTQAPRPAGADHRLARRLAWLDRPFTRDVTSLAVVLIAMMLLAVDFFVHRHAETQLAGASGFYVIAGFASVAVAVLAAWPLRALLTRRRDYYSDTGGDDA